MITVEEAEELSTSEVENLYSQFVNPRQVSLFRRLSPGRDQVHRAEGAWIHLKTGRRILDLTGGIGVLGHGHNHPRILRARAEFAARQRMEVYKSYLSPYTAALAHNIAEILPGDLTFSYFPNSGAEAVEGAVKMAYKFHAGNRNTILVSEIGFHGKTLGAGSLTQSRENNFRFPKISNVKSARYGDIDSWKSKFLESVNADGSSQVFAVLVEPLSSSSMIEASDAFLMDLRKLCDDYGALLIFDEVYTGWGRTGHLFNFMRVKGLVPDILVYAKTLGGGKASIAGYTARKPVYRGAYDTSLSDATLHSTTYFGLAEETVTAIEAVNLVIRDDFALRARKIGESFRQGVHASGEQMGWFREFRNFGALNGFIPDTEAFDGLITTFGKFLGDFIPEPRSLFASRLVSAAATEFLYRKHGVLTYVGFNVGSPLKLSFPLVSENHEVRIAVDAVTELLSLSRKSLLSELSRMFLR